MTVENERNIIHGILNSLDLPRDGVLLVHSSFRGLSRYGLKAELVIEAMLEFVDQGTLLMPAMTWRNVTPASPIFDELETPSHTGVLGEIFRTRYSTARSLHPTHSVAGWGSKAAILLSGHHLGNTPVPSSSPYGLMRDYSSYIFLLGVGMEMCTAIHHPEEAIAPEVYVKPISDCESYKLIARDGRVIEYQLRRHKRLPRRFDKFTPMIGNTGIRTGNISGVPWSLIRVANLMQVVSSALLDDRMATLE